MASDSLTALRIDLAAMKRNEAGLPPELCYLAGACQVRTGLSIRVVQRFLAAVQSLRLAGCLLEPEFFNVCLMVREGKLGEAKSIMDRYSRQIPIREPAINNDCPPLQRVAPEPFSAPPLRSDMQLEEERRSIALALTLQERYNEELSGNIVCQQCNHPVQDFETVKGCGHIFHPLCLLGIVSAKIKEGVCPITCPVLRCQEIIHLDEMKALPFSFVQIAQSFQQSYYYSLQHPSSNLTCPTHNCSTEIEVPDGRDLYCRTCNAFYCLRCRGPRHPGSSCETMKPHLSKNDLDTMLNAVKLGMQLKACPNCKIWNPKLPTQKKITCLCGATYCIRCGARGACKCNTLT